MKLIIIKNLFRVEEIVLNVDLAPTFLDLGGVPAPAHMDGRSILPLLFNKHRNIRDTWPDTFLIESSGRRETPEQIAESRARLQIEKFNMKLANSTFVEDLIMMNGTTAASPTGIYSDVIDLESREEEQFAEVEKGKNENIIRGKQLLRDRGIFFFGFLKVKA